ncbi:MAG: S24 family peptidase [Alphaproteobacteria bacterium]
MIQHDKMWEAIDAIAGINGLTPSGLAKKAGLDPTIFNKSKRISKDGRQRWPSTESIARILDVIGMSMGQFADLMQSNENLGAIGLPKTKLSSLQNVKSFISSTGHVRSNYRDENMESTDIDGKSFMVRINTHDYADVYNRGDTLIAKITSNVRKGDKVIVAVEEGDNIIATIQKISSHVISLKKIGENELENPNIDLRKVKWIARIIWKAE